MPDQSPLGVVKEEPIPAATSTSSALDVVKEEPIPPAAPPSLQDVASMTVSSDAATRNRAWALAQNFSPDDMKAFVPLVRAAHGVGPQGRLDAPIARLTIPGGSVTLDPSDVLLGVGAARGLAAIAGAAKQGGVLGAAQAIATDPFARYYATKYGLQRLGVNPLLAEGAALYMSGKGRGGTGGGKPAPAEPPPTAGGGEVYGPQPFHEVPLHEQIPHLPEQGAAPIQTRSAPPPYQPPKPAPELPATPEGPVEFNDLPLYRQQEILEAHAQANAPPVMGRSAPPPYQPPQPAAELPTTPEGPVPFNDLPLYRQQQILQAHAQGGAPVTTRSAPTPYRPSGEAPPWPSLSQGAHAGERLEDIALKDPQYLRWVRKEWDLTPQMKTAIDHVLGEGPVTPSQALTQRDFVATLQREGGVSPSEAYAILQNALLKRQDLGTLLDQLGLR